MEGIAGEVAAATRVPIKPTVTRKSSKRIRKNVLFARHITIEL
jgi:hypothetical protein